MFVNICVVCIVLSLHYDIVASSVIRDLDDYPVSIPGFHESIVNGQNYHPKLTLSDEVFFDQSTRLRFEPEKSVTFADDLIPILIIYNDRSKSIDKFMESGIQFLCGTVSHGTLTKYGVDCSKAKEREKRFFLSLLFGAIGAGAGVSALHKVDELKSAMTKELSNIKSALTETNKAVKRVGDQVFAITQALPKINDKIEANHRQTLNNFRILERSMASNFNKVNTLIAETVADTEKAINQTAKTLSENAAVMSSRILSEITILDHRMDILATEDVMRGYLPRWYVDTKAMAEKYKTMISNITGKNPTTPDIIEQLGQKFTVLFSNKGDVILAGFLAVGQRGKIYKISSFPIVAGKILHRASVKPIIQVTDNWYDGTVIPKRCHPAGFEWICIGHSALEVDPCISSLHRSSLYMCPVVTNDWSHDCFAEIIDNNQVYIAGICNIQLNSDDVKTVTSHSVLAVGSNDTLKIDGTTIRPVSKSGVSHLKGLSFNGLKPIKIELNITARHIFIDYPTINDTSIDIDLPNNTWYTSFTRHIDNSTALTKKIGKELAKVKFSGITFPNILTQATMWVIVAAQALFDIIVIIVHIAQYFCRV